MASLHRSLEILHNQYNIPHVVISSIPLESWLLSSLPASAQPSSDTPHLLCITSSRPTPNIPFNSTSIIHVQCVPLISGYFSGVGDLFSALVVAHFHPQEKPVDSDTTPLSQAASQALTKTHAILQITHGLSLILPEEERQPTDDELDEKEPLRRIRRMRGRELALIRGQDIIRGNGIRHFRSMVAWDGFWNIVAS
jgi:pyridoxine kinase